MAVVMSWSLAAAISPTASAAVQFSVLNPSAEIEITHPIAARPGDLNGKRIGLWASSADPIYGYGAAFLESLGEALQERYPDIALIPPAEFPTDYHMQDELFAAIEAHGVEAVIGGVGG
ncbi:hypothetical protein [Limnochorda pilosa]|uniref:hypothetical protein n=1 Tax=Limnochorda pilosa TaxID=1555112 RepID=UPI00118743EA|nr:hypothetical protein [Limnochorda pilosa]